MSELADPKPALTWQPLTPRGVVAFARAPLRRLLLLQFLIALLAAMTLVWFLRSAWIPTIRQAASQLPAQGTMTSGVLNWADNSPLLLSEGHFLALVVNTNHNGTLRSPAQIQVEFGRDDIFFYSLAGYREWPYPKDWSFGFNRDSLQPWWGAWETPIQWLAFAGMLFWCMASWWVLATVYFLPVWLGGYFANRDLSLKQSWKLAGTALMPGALLMILVIVFYGFGMLDLVKLALGVVAHVVVSWAYLIWSVKASPILLASSVSSDNPFADDAPPA